ncbi:hypothetical protein [Niabella hibiscisoli]|uniref:hypothetical protein n=1 Tax=Niabella hibiscisoli TaxID=1825928 RepID=UPI001F0D6EFA|nr:hypothetical protein [Niabella hibiscisoli]MCH5720077.1 hypothetical protein [Niabella hibiscisoli]
MTKELTYEHVLHLLGKSQCDTFIQQVTILLTLVHEVMQEKSLNKSDFTFTQYDEGHILIAGIKGDI